MWIDNRSPSFHYCSAEAFFNIVTHETIWASNVFLMNDYSEVRWLLSKAKKEVDERIADISGSQQMQPEIAAFYQQLNQRILMHGFDHIYVSCFSAKEDDLSQWRAYADDGRGICFGVDLLTVSMLLDQRVVETRKVIYSESEQIRVVTGVISTFARRAVGEDVKSEFWNPIMEMGDIHNPHINANPAFRVLSDRAASCKNPKFADEDETRLVIRPHSSPRGWDGLTYVPEFFDGFPSEIQFRVGSDSVIPYTRLHLPRSAIKRVWLGPKFGEDEKEASLRFFLSSVGMDHTIVNRSAASYR